MNTKDILEEIYLRLDRAEVVRDLDPQDKGDYYLLICPRCKKRKAFLYKTGSFINCNRRNECNYSASLWSYLQEAKGLSNQETLRELARLAGVSLPSLEGFDHEAAQKKRSRENLLEDALDVFRSTLADEKKGSAVRSYLLKRGYTERDIDEMGLGAFPIPAALSADLVNRGYSVNEIEDAGLALKSFGSTHRLVIPYRDPVGQLKGFIVRAIDGKTEPKYLYTRDLKRDSLFGLDKVQRGGSVIVVEGFLDALLARARGVKAVVATGGSELTEAQLEDALRRSCTRFVLALDGDAAGQEGTERSITRILKHGAKAYVISIPEGCKDPDELIRAHGEGAFKSLLQDAQKAAKWGVERLLGKHSKHNLQTDQGRDQAVQEFLAFEATLTDFLDSKDATDAFAAALKISPEHLSPLLEAYHEKKAAERVKAGYGDLLREAQARLKNDDIAGLQSLLDEKAREVRSLGVTRLVEPYTLLDLQNDIERTPQGLKTGYPQLDRHVSIPQGQLTIVAGRPSHGKTTLLMNLLLNQAELYKDKSFFFFSYEESRRQIGLKLLNILSGECIDERMNLSQLENYLRGGNTNNSKIEQGKERYRCLEETGRLFITDEPYTVNELCELLSAIQAKHSVGAVFIDYIQKIKSGDKFGTRQLELQRISERLLETAKSLGVPIVLGAQLGRSKEDKDKVRLDNLREAGDLEQDANVVLGLYNKAMERAQDEGEVLRERMVELKVTTLKNRNGAVNEEATLSFDRPLLTITDKESASSAMSKSRYS